jgi:GDPmannose 4,6-dehydratase
VWTKEGLMAGNSLVVRFNKKYFRDAELPHLRGDSSKIENELGWKANVKWEEVAREMLEAD